jgi:uncharacterized membrane protein
MPINRSASYLVLIGAVGAYLILLFFASEPAIRTVLALPLIVFLPGHAVLAAALPTQVTGLPRFVFSVGLSLAIVVLSGLGLHFLSALTRPGWVWALSAITATGYAVAFVRHFADGTSPQWSLSFHLNVAPRDASFYFGSLVAVMVAFLLAATADRQNQEFHFTEFWMVPDRTNEIGTVNIGIRNVEANAASYDLELMLDKGIIAAWRDVRLKKGETWTQIIDLPSPARSRRIEAWLFRAGDHQTVYRRVWLAAKEPS